MHFSTSWIAAFMPRDVKRLLFAVIMTNMSSDLRSVIVNKVNRVHTILADESDDLPLITLSVGAAFSAEGMSDQDIYHAAEGALHQAKQSDVNNIVFYGESNGV